MDSQPPVFLPADRMHERPGAGQGFKVVNLRDRSAQPYAVIDHQGRIVSRWPGPARARSEADALRRSRPAAAAPGQRAAPAPSSPVRRLDVPGVATVWTWPGATDFVQHEVRTDLLHLGITYHTIWAGDTPSPPRQTEALSQEEAESLVTRMRASEADKLAANRFLRSAGFMATEHTAGRTDCNCMDCAPADTRPAQLADGSSGAGAVPVAPAQLAAYLHSRGWRIAGSHRSAPVWAHPSGGAKIFAPHAIEYDDDPELIADALAALARHEGREVPGLARDITGTPDDNRTASHPPATPTAGLRPPATDAELVESCARLAGLLRDLAGQLDGWTHALAALNLPPPVLAPLHAASTAVDGAVRHADHARAAFLATFGAAHQTAASGLRITGDRPA